MKQLTPLQKIDLVLDHLKKSTQNLINNTETVSFEINRREKVIIEDDELKMIVRKLIKDGYVDEVRWEHVNVLKISFEGSIFIGYEKKQRLEDEKLTSISKGIIATKKYANQLLWATSCAGIAAALVLLWQVFLWFYPAHSDFPLIWIWEAIPKHKK
ncbi:MAG TPA: hypothetical protein VGN20_16850 [Mucilaginibacter sp.]|jgi:hypothetical protein